MLIYLAGPMTGYEAMNGPAFEEARRSLEARYPDAGVFVPHDLFGGRQDLDREVYLGLELAVIAASSLIAVLPGWKESAGASAEVAFARQIGKPIYFMREGAVV